MDRPHMFEIVLVELGQAFAAAHRYERLRHATTGRDHDARPDIPQRIFEEFYAGRGEIGDASRTRDKSSEMTLRRAESAAT